ncbi:MAG: peptidase U32 family protein [Bacteriovoracaceae bacterium]
MKMTTYAQSLHDLSVLKEAGLDEVILAHESLSRFGKLSTPEILKLVARAKELHLQVYLEWDILMTQNVFESALPVVLELLPSIDGIRVQDPGALHWVIENLDTKIHFIAENGNHNITALETWISLSKGKLERIVLSLELSKSTIEDYVKRLSVPCELLGFGRILLFYTPRALLSPLAPEKIAQNSELVALGESEESPHKGFPIVENRHGTFMFHIKEFCLIEFAQELKEFGLKYLRVDLRWTDFSYLLRLSQLIQVFNSEEFDHFKQEYPQDLMRGFYLVNKTDVLFPKLKNGRLQKREGNYLGEVMEAEKGSHLAIMVKNSRGIKKSDKLSILHPEGKTFEVSIHSLKNSALEEVEEIPQNKLAVIQFVGGVWVKSQVFLS